MPDNAFVKIGTALFKHQIKKLVGEKTLGVISEELADIGGDKLDALLGDKSTIAEIEKAATTARDSFCEKVGDVELEQYMHDLPLHNLSPVTEALAELPTSPDETKLESALRETIALDWKKLSAEQIDNAVNSFLSCLRSALLPIEKQTLMVIGHSVLRTEGKVDVVKSTVIRSEEKIDLLFQLLEKQLITGKSATIESLKPESGNYWNLKHPYAMPPNFTGRVDERRMLADWLNNDKENHLFILRALGGFGKSALAWHWLTHDVDSKQWSKVLWWSFYESNASFENFIIESLEYLNIDVPQGQRKQVDELLKAMQSKTVLLVMDGFERALRAYSVINAAYLGDEETKTEDNQRDCVNINAEIFLKNFCLFPNIKSKVLMTTRLTPKAVEQKKEFLAGCHEKELQAIQKEDAVAFFQKLNINGTRSEIESACEPYGYHPLSLRVLAGLIADNRENPGDISIANRIDITDDIVANKNHVLKVAFGSLSVEQQKLLSTIACFRSPMTYNALKSITSASPSPKGDGDDFLKERLKTLETRGLIHWDRKTNIYDLHPIVRRYAYEHLTVSERTAAHIRLRDYFNTIPIQRQAKTVQELVSVIELFHHCVRAGRYREALSIFQDRLNEPLYVAGGEYILCVELLEGLLSAGADNLFLNDANAQSWLLNKLALCYNRIGRSHEAELTFKKQIAIRENMSYLAGVAIGLGNLSEVLIRMGKIIEATATLKRKIDISKQIGDQFKEMVGRQDYGLVLTYQGEFEESEKQLKATINWLSERSRPREESVSWTFYTLSRILQGNVNKALESAKQANQLALVEKRRRDIVRVQWLMGVAYRLNGQLDFAERHLSEALEGDRAINLVELEANILLAIARLRYDQKNNEEAKSLADEALTITERCGYVLQGADVNLFLAEYALAQEQDKAKAKEYAEAAKKLATCDGPPYYYKVAYEEAERFLEKLK